MMTLEQLIAALERRLNGRQCVIRWRERYDGSQIAAVFVSGRLFACWRAHLVNPPVFDGVTPRGEKVYHSLRFFDGATGLN